MCKLLIGILCLLLGGLVGICMAEGGETCETATVMTLYQYWDSGTLVDRTDDCPGAPYYDVFYRFTPGGTSPWIYAFCMPWSYGDTYMRIWTSDTCCSGSYYTADNEAGGLDPWWSCVLAPNQTIYLECGMKRSTDEPGDYNFLVSVPLSEPWNEACGSPEIVIDIPYSFGGIGLYDDCLGAPYHDLFYEFTAPASQYYNFDMCGSDGDTYMRIWTDGICCSGNHVDGDKECGDDPRLSLSLAEGQTVFIECGMRDSTDLPVEFVFNIAEGVPLSPYYWANTCGEGTGTTPPSPRYDWQTITTNSVTCGINDTPQDGILGNDDWEGSFPIGFTFNYFGVDYDSFCICSNGYLMLGNSGSTSNTNVCIANPIAPNNMLAWFWDDLVPISGSSAVYYGNAYSGGYPAMVVTFMNFQRHNSPGRITAQVILKSNGNIKYQYADIDSSFITNSGTIGIENQIGTDGINYLCNGAGGYCFRDSMAIEFGPHQSPLPVELTSFTGLGMDEAIRLQWTTASETNNDHFVLYRSAAAEGQFIQIATANGAGSSPTEHTYSYVDQNLINGVTYYYRLANVDINGTVTNHDITVNATPTSGAQGVIITEYQLYQNYPNPFNPVTTITYDVKEKGHVTLKAYNLLGQEVATLVDEVKNNNRYQGTFDASGLAAGVYFYRLSVNDFNQVCKMVLLK